jgi:hypothetical protein
MPISVLIPAAGFVAAIIILRTNQWIKYNEEAKCTTSLLVGLTWSFSSVLFGILSILFAFLKSLASNSLYVDWLAISFFISMVFMALFDIIVPLSLVFYKSIRRICNSKSMLIELDSENKNQIRWQGKFLLMVELYIIIIIPMVVYYTSHLIIDIF